MKANVKFTFYLKNGKTFECVEELNSEQFLKITNVCKQGMRDDNSGMICFEDCCIRLSEVAIAEWEVLDE